MAARARGAHGSLARCRLEEPFYRIVVDQLGRRRAVSTSLLANGTSLATGWSYLAMPIGPPEHAELCGGNVGGVRCRDDCLTTRDVAIVTNMERVGGARF